MLKYQSSKSKIFMCLNLILFLSLYSAVHGTDIDYENHLQYDHSRKMLYFGKNLNEQFNEEHAPLPLAKTENKVVYALLSVESQDLLSSPIKAQSFPINLVESILQETVLGDTDRRELVDHPNQSPWHFHGHMIMDFGGGSKYIGTGTLIDDKYVITAAHNLFDRKTNSLVKEVTFYPGLRQRTVYHMSKADRVVFHSQYQLPNENDIKDIDIGLLRLKDPIGKNIGFLKLKSLNDIEIKDKNFVVNVTGYPGDYAQGKLMCTMSGPIKDYTSNRIFYDVDTARGQSGSGIWIKDSDQDYKVVGVHTHGDDEGKKLNSGIRINAEKLNLIQEWIRDTNS